MILWPNVIFKQFHIIRATGALNSDIAATGAPTLSTSATGAANSGTSTTSAICPCTFASDA